MANLFFRSSTSRKKRHGSKIISANTQMDNDVTPVYLAAQEGHLEVLKFLVLEAGGSLYVRAKDGMAPVHAASQMGCLNCVKWMIQEQGVDPNLRDGDGATPLHFAASRGHLDTVKWLLKHGARLSLDKFGKSPINDAAENQQVECLNVLVQHGTTPDYKENEKHKHPCSCVKKNETKRISNIPTVDCTNCVSHPSNESESNEPFYLHPPVGNRPPESPHAPQDGLYINPMNTHRHSASTSSDSSSSGSLNGESFYLHNPQEVIYNRVKDLFDGQPQKQGLSALTVKVEVHSSSSGAGSDGNLSSSDISERSGEHEHDYEDIYLVREESKKQAERAANQQRSRSRDSGSHSRSGSASSTNSGCDVVVKVAPQSKEKKEIYKTNEFLPKPQKYDKYEKKPKKEERSTGESGLSSSPSALSSEEEVEKTKLGPRHSVPIPENEVPYGRQLKRVTSVPAISTPPPPPPLPANNNRNRKPPERDEGGEPRGAEVVEIVEEPSVRPSDVVKGMVKTMSALSSRRLNSSCSDLTIVSSGTDAEEKVYSGPNLVNKQRALPFVPPSFPGGAGNSNNLIKPSEYLRSITGKRSPMLGQVRRSSESEASDEKRSADVAPPPPPAPKPPEEFASAGGVPRPPKMQPAVSIHDLNSVQLKRTEKMAASKTFSAPTRSMSLQSLQTASEPFAAQKTDLIAELKMSKSIHGIKKMKLERAKNEVSKEKEMYMEISKQFTATNFVEKIPDKDNTGNLIPAWKRQMLAKKAAERARKELEDQLLKEAEEKRLQSIPQWKRQLLAKKEEAECRMKTTLYTPKVVDDHANKIKVQELERVKDVNNNKEYEDKKVEDMNNNNSMENANINTSISSGDSHISDDDTPIIPWRAQLRKTNSKLNLLD